MEKRRKELSAVFKAILAPYKGHSYYQPPPNVKLEYPAVIYGLKKIYNKRADSITYLQNPAFQVTVIERNPDAPIASTVSRLPLCEHDRAYNADGLTHNVFTIY